MKVIANLNLQTMDRALITVSFFLISFYLNGQVRSDKGITFEVSDVKITKNNLEETTYKRAIEQRISRLIEGYPIENKEINIVPTGFNAFVASVHFAYAEHRPLIISPDMIWLSICQGFSIHVNKNYKELQSKVVAHQGKKEILIRKNDFRKGENNPWEEVFETFTDSIKKYTKHDLYSLVVADFSTTSTIETAAYQITLMEGTKKYFEAVMETGCGIPEITLEGTVEDWKWIRLNVERFRAYNLDIWIDNLIPVLDEFVLASEGRVNKEFWQSIYKESEHYTPVYSTGWLLKFFPYYQKWSNDWERHYRYTNYLPNPYIVGEDYRLSKLTTEDFPSGVSKFPFLWKYEVRKVKKTYEMEIYAGFVGVRQDKETKSVRAEISWAIRDKKSSWLSAVSTGSYPKSEEPYEYFYTDIEKEPTSKPIFMPKECKTYSQGISKLNKYIKQQVCSYKAKEHLKGKVTVRFVVTWAGTIANVEIGNRVNSREGIIAKQIISELPKWKPGIKQQFWQRKLPENYSINYSQSVLIDFDTITND